MSQDAFVGELMTVAFNWAPENFQLCDGSIIGLQNYMALYSLIGVVYGGDGRSTFGVPDLRGRVIVGQGQGQNPTLTARTIGQKDGTETTALTINNLPAHNHLVTAPQSITATGTIAKTSIPIDANSVVHCDPTGASSGDPAGAFPGAGASTWSGNAGGSMNPQMVTTTASVTSDVPVSVNVTIPALTTTMTGGSMPINTMQPWLCLNYCIAMNGYYPPRP